MEIFGDDFFWWCQTDFSRFLNHTLRPIQFAPGCKNRSTGLVSNLGKTYNSDHIIIIIIIFGGIQPDWSRFSNYILRPIQSAP